MKIAYLASDKIAVPILEHLIGSSQQEVALVGSRPDKNARRGLKLTATPVKQIALANELDVFTEKPSIALFKQHNIDLILVFAYGLFISQEVYENIPTINIHPSLLPKYRGPSPIQTALLNGDLQTGVTLFHIDQQMDAGDVVFQEKLDIDINDNYQKLSEKVIDRSIKLTSELLKLSPEQISAKRTPQDDSQATFCQMLQKEDQRVSLGESIEKIHNKVRAIGGFVETGQKRIKIIETKRTAEGLEILKVQLPGKKVINYQDFLNANPPLDIGEVIK